MMWVEFVMAIDTEPGGLGTFWVGYKSTRREIGSNGVGWYWIIPGDSRWDTPARAMERLVENALRPGAKPPRYKLSDE